MGLYINPREEEKEDWLCREAERIETPPEVKEFDWAGDKLVVCLIDNGAFTAAGVAFDEGELKDFARPDGRPRKWYLVERERLKELFPERIWEILGIKK